MTALKPDTHTDMKIKYTQKQKERILKLGNEYRVLLSKIQNPRNNFETNTKIKGHLENILGQIREIIFEKEFHFQDQCYKLFLTCSDPITAVHKKEQWNFLA